MLTPEYCYYLNQKKVPLNQSIGLSKDARNDASKNVEVSCEKLSNEEQDIWKEWPFSGLEKTAFNEKYRLLKEAARKDAKERCEKFSRDEQDAWKENAIFEAKLAVGAWIVSQKVESGRDIFIVKRRDIDDAVQMLRDAVASYTDHDVKLDDLLDRGEDIFGFLKSSVEIYTKQRYKRDAQVTKQQNGDVEINVAPIKLSEVSVRQIASHLPKQKKMQDDASIFQADMDLQVAFMQLGHTIRINFGEIAEQDVAVYCQYFENVYAPKMIIKITGQFDTQAKLFKAFFDSLEKNNAIETMCLDISNCELGNEGMECLSVLKKINMLNVSDNNLGDKAGEYLGKLTNLIDLNVADNNLQCMGMQSLSTLINLVSLNVGNNGVSQYGLKNIGALKNLERLNISHNNLTSLSIVYLAELQKLTVLITVRINLDITGVQNMKLFKALHTLNVTGNNLGEDAGVILGSIENLRVVGLK